MSALGNFFSEVGESVEVLKGADEKERARERGDRSGPHG